MLTHNSSLSSVYMYFLGGKDNPFLTSCCVSRVSTENDLVNTFKTPKHPSAASLSALLRCRLMCWAEEQHAKEPDAAAGAALPATGAGDRREREKPRPPGQGAGRVLETASLG